MKFTDSRRTTGVLQIFAASLLLFSAVGVASEAEDRFLIMELMDRYGVVHDFGSPEEYADLFTAEGEIGTRTKGREALITQAKRDHERFSAPPGPDGKVSSIMRHIISNRVVKLTGKDTAEGSCYVITMINDKKDGPLVMSLSRYVDRYARTKDGWRIAHRDIVMESGNQEIGKRFGFGR
ncbi:MAG: nuclear transport factor 2 family protein [Steroidobacteraceae bacterium]